MMKIIIRIITSIAFGCLYITALEETIIYFKDQIDQSQFTWCCFSIGMVSTSYFAFYSVVMDKLKKWTKN